MSAQTREQLFIRAKQLLNEAKHPEIPDMLWFYTDQKSFDQDQKINRRNDSWLCGDSSDILHVIHTKFLETVMVLGVVRNEGQVIPPHFFHQGLQVNATTYIDVLEAVVNPWIDSMNG